MRDDRHDKVIWGGGVPDTNLIRRFGKHGPHPVELAPLFIPSLPVPPLALQVQTAKRQAARAGYVEVMVGHDVLPVTPADAADPAGTPKQFVLGKGGETYVFRYHAGEESDVAQQIAAMVRSPRNPTGVLHFRDYVDACTRLLKQTTTSAAETHAA